MKTTFVRCAAVLVGLLASPAAASPKTMAVESGKAFVLRKGQRAKLKDADVFIQIAGFINSPCPKRARCIWSGQKVDLVLSVAGATIPLSGASPFDVKIVSSDFKSSATLLISPRK